MPKGGEWWRGSQAAGIRGKPIVEALVEAGLSPANGRRGRDLPIGGWAPGLTQTWGDAKGGEWWRGSQAAGIRGKPIVEALVEAGLSPANGRRGRDLPIGGWAPGLTQTWGDAKGGEWWRGSQAAGIRGNRELPVTVTVL